MSIDSPIGSVLQSINPAYHLPSRLDQNSNPWLTSTSSSNDLMDHTGKDVGITLYHMSLVVRKPAFCLCENKDADQLRGNREADQRLCFRYTDSTIPLLPKDEISSFKPSCVIVQPGLCRTWSETPKTGFLMTRLISRCCYSVNKVMS